MEKLSDWIYIVDGALSEDFCAQVIEKFEHVIEHGDSTGFHGKRGEVGAREYRPEVKKSWDYCIEPKEWPDIDEVFYKSLGEHYTNYLENPPWSNLRSSNGYDNLRDTGYNLQKTLPGDGYIWHNDFGNGGDGGYDKGIRILTFIWYLNDIEEDGYTEFIDGTKIQPKAGRMVIFPCTWQYEHRGYPPKSETKYICTGWMHTQRVCE